MGCWGRPERVKKEVSISFKKMKLTFSTLFIIDTKTLTPGSDVFKSYMVGGPAPGGGGGTSARDEGSKCNDILGSDEAAAAAAAAKVAPPSE